MTKRERTVWTSTGGYALLWLSELAGIAALVTIPAWLLHLSSPAARPGSAIMIGPAVMVTAVAAAQLVRSRLRAAFTLSALAAAASAAAAVWPLPALTWVAAYGASKILRYGAHEFIQPPRAARLGAGTMLLALAGVIAVGRVAPRAGSGAWSLQLTASLGLLAAILLTVIKLLAFTSGSRRSTLLDRLETRWHDRRLQQLRRQGLRPLDPVAAPLLYRRVEPAGERIWSWEARVGQSTVAGGSARTSAKAERAANRACFAYTFRPPAARRPGALYVLATRNGNPFRRQVVDITRERRVASDPAEACA